MVLPVAGVSASAYTVPTDLPESDGTFTWDRTTIVIAEVRAGSFTGIGWTYSTPAAVRLIQDVLSPVLQGGNAADINALWTAMHIAVRNIGRNGVAMTAISAVDAALWDLKARALNISVADLAGRARESVPVYGSGGFTSYDNATLKRQMQGWVDDGIRMVKMKVGRNPEDDPRRVHLVRKAIGDATSLFVDANGACRTADALALAAQFHDDGVTWFEEPVTSDDLHGLRFLRRRVPEGMEIAAGEYGWTLTDFRRMLEARAVDVLQADATRCGGVTGFLAVAALADAFAIPLSAHTSPSLHLCPCCAVRNIRHIEYFHDHVRIEQMFFDGVPLPVDGDLHPDLTKPGFGLEFKRTDAEPYRVT